MTMANSLKQLENAIPSAKFLFFCGRFFYQASFR
jgi:hypothetical protein